MNPKQREDAIEAALSSVPKREHPGPKGVQVPDRAQTGTRLEQLQRTLARAHTGLEQARKERSTMQSNYYLPWIEDIMKEIKAEKEREGR